MRKVIDSNYLQSPALRDYLSASNDNFAVLTDYAAMEAYKGDTLKSIYPSMAIVSEFPRQVLILKPTSKIVGLSGREKGLQRRLIDKHQTSGFPKFCADLLAARSGNKALEKSLVRMGKEASEHLEKVMSDAAKLPEAHFLTAAYKACANVRSPGRITSKTRPTRTSWPTSSK